MATMLGVAPDVAENIKSTFNFTITGINRMTPAELNEEFFVKVFTR